MTRKTNTLGANRLGVLSFRAAFLPAFFVLAFHFTGFTQCSPDRTPPVARCIPSYTGYLTDSGRFFLLPSMIDNFSADACTRTTITTGDNCLFQCGDIGPRTITLYAYDVALNRSSCTSVVTVRDTTRPKISGCSQDLTYVVANGACEQPNVTFPTPSVWDNCTPASRIQVTLTQGRPSGSTYPIGTHRITFQAADSSGNKNTCSFLIHVREAAMPTGNLTCFTQTQVSLDDNCVGVVSPASLINSTNVHCFNDYTVRLTYNSLPLAGDKVQAQHLGQRILATITSNRNGATCSGEVLVVDRTAPKIEPVGDVIIECGQLGGQTTPSSQTTGEPRIVSECSGTPQTYYNDLIFNNPCSTFTTKPLNYPFNVAFDSVRARASTRILVREFSVRDIFGNIATTKQVIYIRQSTLDLGIFPADATLSCSSAGINTSPDTMMLGGIKVAGTGRPTYIGGDFLSRGSTCMITAGFEDRTVQVLNGYEIRRTWTLTSDCTQQTRTFTQTIKVTDQAPALSCRSGFQAIIDNRDSTATVAARFLTSSLSDNCTPLSNIELGIRRAGLGTGFPTNESLYFRCADTGLYLVEVWARDGSGLTNSCLANIRVSDPNYVCNNKTVVTGTILTELGRPVNAKVIFGGSSNWAARTNSAGQFNVPNLLRGGNFTLTPERDSDWVTGVTTADINMMSRYILGNISNLSPYQTIAADVNRDSFVDAVDMLLTRRLILIMIPKVEPNTAWRFVPKTFNFPITQSAIEIPLPSHVAVNNLRDSVGGNDFIAIKTGDINSSVVGMFVGGGTVEPRGDNPLIINAKDAVLEAGKTYEITLTKPQTDIAGFQFTLNYDKSLIQFAKILPLELSDFGENNYAIFSDKGKITVSWNHPSSGSIAEPMNMLSLRFTARQSGRLSDALRLTSDLTPAEAFDAAGVIRTVKLKFSSKNTEGGDFALFNAEPNPAAVNTLINIPFRLPQATAVKLTLMDETGRVLLTKSQNFEKGENIWRIETPSVSGVVFYQIQTPTHAATRRLVIIR